MIPMLNVDAAATGRKNYGVRHHATVCGIVMERLFTVLLYSSGTLCVHVFVCLLSCDGEILDCSTL